MFTLVQETPVDTITLNDCRQEQCEMLFGMLVLDNDRQKTNKTPVKILIDLMKIYSNDGKKYKGEEYDILDIKLQVFYDCCSKIGLLEMHHYKAYLIMLKD